MISDHDRSLLCSSPYRKATCTNPVSLPFFFFQSLALEESNFDKTSLVSAFFFLSIRSNFLSVKQTSAQFMGLSYFVE